MNSLPNKNINNNYGIKIYFLVHNGRVKTFALAERTNPCYKIVDINF